MAFSIKKHIPNTLTCCNLISGCVSLMAALKGNLDVAALWIIIAAVFDFSDGMVARLLKVQSAIGKELDSLSDMVSFGVAPGMVIYTWLSRCLVELPPHVVHGFAAYLPLAALLVPALSAVRLAKFNVDDRQKTVFIGMPTPANALFWAFIPDAAEQVAFLNNFWVILALTVFFSFLLVAPIAMLSLKFSHFRWKGNGARYILAVIALILLPLFRLGAFPVIILVYLLMSFILHFIQKAKIV